MDAFSEPTRLWIAESFAAPTPAQAQAWAEIAAGGDVLVVAPTGSGKTLAAFLWSIDRIAAAPPPDPKKRLRVLYVSPLKALAADIERNLRAPLSGIRSAALRQGLPPGEITVGVRTGDTPSDERRRFTRTPPDILVTTPESLFLILTSQAREMLRSVDTVIVDEVHALVATKRGAHFALSLERLDRLAGARVQRIGLSATVQPVEEVARFLGGAREVAVVRPPARKALELRVEAPHEEGDEVWPALDARLLELVGAHRSTIVFANSRRLAERVSARLNESAGTAVARAHHGSINHELRRAIEEDLKAGRLPAVVATSSLELGIDMGDVDLVVQIESPPSVASGLQRIGRAGHQVGAVSRGVLLPRWRGDLVECAVVVERMRNGEIEPLRYPRNPLDVLAQHVVSMAAMDEWTVAALGELVRGAAPFATLPQPALESVLDMLSGRYPSDEFAELRPRLNWDRVSNVLSGRSNAQRLAVTGGGTIPDRGLFGVFLVGGAEGDSPWIRSGQKQTRVGELDEEMVYESRRGDVIVLGASSWRIEDITHDRVLVTPAPGVSGKTPFWHGDAPGRPLALGRAHGAFLREIGDDRARLLNAGLDERAADSLLGYLAEQRAAVSVLPDDRTIVMERFPDAVGDWRVCIHSPFGAQVHAPWAMAIAARIHQQLGVDVQTMHTDDGIIVRLPESDTTPAADLMLFDPDEIEPLVTAHLGGSSLFASRFRECAGRALLLGRRQPGKRTPLWQQRQKSASLLQVAAGYGSFPIVLETMRECLQDVFDVPGLRGLMADIRARAVRVVVVQTERASPFASALLFNYLGAFIYEGDAPLAERRAQALSIDTALLSELMGQAELREILNADAMHEVEASLQKRTPERRLRDADDVHDALRVLGDLSTAEIESRGDGLEQGASGSEQPVSTGLIAGAWPVLERQRRIIPVRVAGEARWIAVEDAGRYRDALGVPLPGWVPAVFLEPVPTAVRDLVARYARTHGPFVPADVARRLGLSTTAVGDALHALERAGKVVRGEFRPGGQGVEWCDQDVLRALRRRSLARLRKEVEAVPRQVLARFLPAWQGVGARGADAVLRAVVQLQGAPLPASALETLILPARAADYHPAMLDDLCASGDVVWAGAGEGWISLYLAEDVALLRPPPAAEALSESARQAAAALQDAGALFFRQIAERVHAVVDTKLLEALWELVWAGLVTNDTIHCLRAWLGAPLAPGKAARRRARRGPPLPTRSGPPAGAGRWWLLPEASTDVTRRRALLAEQMLDRHGVLTREAEPGFGTVYPVLKAMEEAGRCRRGYFVEGLGGAQFALPGAVDRLRSFVDGKSGAVVLAAADPANPYGAALPWPESGGARPGRKEGALVVLVGGALALYVEKGGRSLLTFGGDVEAAARALVDAARGNWELHVERVNSESVFGTPMGAALLAAGLRETHKGMVLRVTRFIP